MKEIYDKNSIYIVGSSKTSSSNAITTNFNEFFIGFVVNKKDDKIIDLSCTSILRTTEKFIWSIFINKQLNEYDISIENDIRNRYFGSSQKAIIVAYKDAFKKYKEIKKSY